MLQARGWCPVHHRDEEQEKRVADLVYDTFKRDPEMAAFYGSPEWEGARRRQLEREPICQMCRHATATVVHHKTPAKLLSPTARLDPANFESACGPCHSRHEWRVSHGVTSYQFKPIDWEALRGEGSA